MKYFRLILGVVLLILISCEKDIDINLPDTESKLVVEGSIEQGLPPFVILTKSVGYFEPTDIQTFQNLFVHNAVVTVSNGTNNIVLTEICTDQLPDSLLPSIAELIGVSLFDLNIFNFCLYTTLDPLIFGEVGKTYTLNIQAENKTLTSTTNIPPLIYMDYYYYKDQPGYNDYGYVWFRLQDPPALGNSYRFFTQRKGKDDRFIPTLISVYNDELHLFNGLNFEYFIYRGHELSSTDPEDLADTKEYFHQGDTIMIKFCTIDQAHFEFWNTIELSNFNNGNPFAAPATIRSNIEGGGLGVWGGYGVTYDTIVAVD
jgi:hypothetical protein